MNERAVTNDKTEQAVFTGTTSFIEDATYVYVDEALAACELTAAQAREVAFNLLDAADAADQANGVAFFFDFDPFESLRMTHAALQSDQL